MMTKDFRITITHQPLRDVIIIQRMLKAITLDSLISFVDPTEPEVKPNTDPKTSLKC